MEQAQFLDVEEHDQFQDANNWENGAEERTDEDQALPVSEVDDIAGNVKLCHANSLATIAVFIKKFSERFQANGDKKHHEEIDPD